MNTTPTTDLMNPKQLGDEFGISNMTVQNWLDDAKLSPEITVPYGRGVMRLYEPNAARRVVSDRMPKKKKPVIVVTPVADNDDPIALLTEQIEQLKSQNRVLYRLIADNLVPKVDTLLAKLESL